MPSKPLISDRTCLAASWLCGSFSAGAFGAGCSTCDVAGWLASATVIASVDSSGDCLVWNRNTPRITASTAARIQARPTFKLPNSPDVSRIPGLFLATVDGIERFEPQRAQVSWFAKFRLPHVTHLLLNAVATFPIGGF